jgi:UDP-N-acetylmuramate--alanine ligase
VSAGRAGAWSGRELHLIGLAGAGMSAYAIAAHALGATVTGSDRAWSPYAQELLEQTAIRVTVGHDAANVPPGDRVEVFHSTAIADDNPERVAAHERGLPDESRTELLRQIAAQRRVIAVAGAHGKTTTTAMVAVALRACDLDPAWLIGGEVPDLGANAGWGQGTWLAVEADESDRSFLALHSEIAIVTNVELDHHAVFATLAEIEDAFAQFLGQTKHAIVTPPVAPLARAALRHDTDAVTVVGDQIDGLAIPGTHNATNAALALEAVTRAGGDRQLALDALRAFRGVGRRFEELGRSASGALVVDDYAHHPTEIAATIAAARQRAPQRIVAVFQPHLYSRTAALAPQFAAALAQADAAWVLDVYPAREDAADFPGVSGRLVADAAGARYAASFDDAEQELTGELRDGDLLLVMGAGDVTELARRMVA